MRSRGVVAAAVALTVLLAGCGAGGSNAPERELDAADQDWLKSVRLAEGDLGEGWREEPADPDDEQGPEDCDAIDYSDLTVTAEDSQTFARDDGAFAFVAWEVYESADEARESVDRGTEDEIEECLARTLAEELATDPEVEFRFEGFRLQKGTDLPVGETVRSFRLSGEFVGIPTELTAAGGGSRPTAQEGEERIPMEMDLVVFARDRAVAVVMVTSGAAPDPELTELFAFTADGQMAEKPPPKS